MNKGTDRSNFRFFPKSEAKRKQPLKQQDYRTRLESRVANETKGVDQRTTGGPYAERIERIVTRLHGSIACQSVAIAAMQTLEGVLQCELAAEKAAISLAQGDRLREMIRTSESTLYALAAGLNAQGSHLMSFFEAPDASSAEENSWWFALSETLEAIERGIQRLLSLTSTQPKGGAAREVSTIVVQLLRSKQRELLGEAEAWIS